MEHALINSGSPEASVSRSGSPTLSKSNTGPLSSKQYNPSSPIQYWDR
jgi:hypothetical protein